jgi:hypothetical protein
MEAMVRTFVTRSNSSPMIEDIAKIRACAGPRLGFFRRQVRVERHLLYPASTR